MFHTPPPIPPRFCEHAAAAFWENPWVGPTHKPPVGGWWIDKWCKQRDIICTRESSIYIQTKIITIMNHRSTKERTWSVVWALLFGCTCHLLLLWNMEVQEMVMHRKLSRGIVLSGTTITTDQSSTTAKDEDLMEMTTTILRRKSAARTTTETTESTTTISTTPITTGNHLPRSFPLFLTVQDLGNDHHEAYAASW